MLDMDPTCHHVYNWTGCEVLGSTGMYTILQDSQENNNLIEFKLNYFIRYPSNIYTWYSRTKLRDLVDISRTVF